MRSHLGAAALPVALLLSLSACSDGGDTAAPAPEPTASATASATPDAAPPAARVDWADPTSTALAGGWTLGPCDGDAPLVCFSYGGQVQGSAELTEFPVDSLPGVRDALAAGRSEAEALEVHAREYLESFRSDRLQGCGATYAFDADEPVAMTAAGTPAVKTAFSGGAQAAAPTERVVRWVAIREGRLVSLGLHATDEGACTPGEGAELSTAQLAELEPQLDRLVEASPLPAGAA